MSELDGIDVEDLEAVAPEAIKKVKSQPNSPFASREASPIRASDRLSRYCNDLDNGCPIDYIIGNSHDNTNRHLRNGHFSTAEPSDDEYIDTVEDDPQSIEEPVRYSRPFTRRSRQLDSGALHNNESYNGSTNTKVAINHSTEAVPPTIQISKMVESMKSDLQQIHSRISLLERSLSEVRNQQLRKKILELRYPRWWPFAEISPTWFMFMILWPFMALRIMQAIQRKK